jgi:DNA topoisomerase-1
VENDSQIDYPAIQLGADPETGQAVVVRIGRYGPYVQIGEGPDAVNASIPDDVPPADFKLEDAVRLARARKEGPRTLGNDPKSGLPVYVMTGRFGPYVQLGETPEKGSKVKPRRASLTKGDTEDGITLDRALELLSLPRLVGHDAEAGEDIVANFGRFGPYVKRGNEFRSLSADAEVFTVTLDQAIELFKQEKKSRRRSAAKTTLRDLGAHPESGATVQIFEGRYGPYVSDGTTNASLPKDVAPDALTLADAVALLKAREGAAPAKRRARKAPATKRAAGTRKTATRKRTA